MAEAFADSKMMAENIMSLFPRDISVLAYAHKLLIDSSDALHEFMKHNVYYGTKSLLGKGAFSEWVSSRPTIDLLDLGDSKDKLEKIKILAAARVSEALDSAPFEDKRDFLYSVPSGRLVSLSELVPSSSPCSLAQDVLKSCCRNQETALLVSHCNNRTPVPKWDLVRLMDSAKYFGWYGNSTSRRRLSGPFASVVNLNDERALLYDLLEEQVSYDHVRRTTFRKYEHKLFWSAYPSCADPESLTLLMSGTFQGDLVHSMLRKENSLGLVRIVEHTLQKMDAQDSFLYCGVVEQTDVHIAQLGAALVMQSCTSALEIPLHRLSVTPRWRSLNPVVQLKGAIKIEKVLPNLKILCKSHPLAIDVPSLRSALDNSLAFELSEIEPSIRQSILNWSSEVLRTLGASTANLNEVVKNLG